MPPESHEERKSAAHESDGEHHLHERLERMEKHLGLPKYDHAEAKKSTSEKREDAMRKRHRR